MIIDISQALLIIKQFCQLTDTTNDALLTSFLTESSAISKSDSVTVVYRPYIVAARFIGFNPLRDGVQVVEGINFVDQNTLIKNLLALQRASDRLITNIPVGWSVWDFERPLHIPSAFIAY